MEIAAVHRNGEAGDSMLPQSFVFRLHRATVDHLTPLYRCREGESEMRTQSLE